MSTESTFDYGDDEQPGHMMTKKQFDEVNKHMFKAQSVPPTASTQAEQEPVAIAECHVVHGHMCQFLNRTAYGMQVLKDGDKLYTAPQPVQPATQNVQEQFNAAPVQNDLPF